MLFILDEVDKPTSAADVDRIVSAEIPNPETHPLAYETVITTMVHDPCGLLGPEAKCMKNGTCSKNYPFGLSEETILSDGGNITYRRRNIPGYLSCEIMAVLELITVGLCRIISSWLPSIIMRTLKLKSARSSTTSNMYTSTYTKATIAPKCTWVRPTSSKTKSRTTLMCATSVLRNIAGGYSPFQCTRSFLRANVWISICQENA
ncbi:hypothetical protein [Parasitella parasitica]|uniref:Uncharacterized protein n=1 Tax=Parasitella parasitica TaxID=35722 RepID=A0A0B7NLK0_9FUNG|nr:hypothetical protein [Parasitella parasitica]